MRFQILILLFSAFFASAKEPVTLSVGIQPPYIDIDGQSGLAIDLINKALSKKGISYQTNVVSWSEAERLIDNKKHLSVMWTKSFPLQQKWLYSKPVFNISLNYVSTANNKVNVLTDTLENQIIGLTKTNQAKGKLTELALDNSFSVSESNFLSLRRLIKGELDLALMDLKTAQYLNQQYFKNQLVVHQQPVVSQMPVYFVCAKSYSKCYQYIDMVNKVISP